MNEIEFEELLGSVRDMGRHMRGEKVEGIMVKDIPDPNVKAIREQTGLSRSSHWCHAQNITKLGM